MKNIILFLNLGLLAIFSCGDDPATTTNNNNTPVTNFCAKTADCPTMGDLAGWPSFTQRAELVCQADVDGNGYCSECQFGTDCQPGSGCVNRTYCEELDPCSTGIDCTVGDSQIHLACIKSLCAPCDDEIQCDVNNGEMCYNRLCVPRINVEPTCIDGTCEGTCGVLDDLDGNPKGFECVK